MPPGLRRSLLVVMLACAVGVVGTAHFFRYLRSSGRIGAGRPEPTLPVYPLAGEVRSQENEVLGWRSITYHVPENYPSTRVFDFYRETLESRGYQRAGKNARPSWQPQQGDKEIPRPKGRDGGPEGLASRRLVLSAEWIDPEGLRLLQLEVTAREEFVRDRESGRLIERRILPGQEVACTLSRKVFLPPGGQ